MNPETVCHLFSKLRDALFTVSPLADILSLALVCKVLAASAREWLRVHCRDVAVHLEIDEAWVRRLSLSKSDDRIVIDPQHSTCFQVEESGGDEVWHAFSLFVEHHGVIGFSYRVCIRKLADGQRHIRNVCRNLQRQLPQLRVECSLETPLTVFNMRDRRKSLSSE